MEPIQNIEQLNLHSDKKIKAKWLWSLSLPVREMVRRDETRVHKDENWEKMLTTSLAIYLFTCSSHKTRNDWTTKLLFAFKNFNQSSPSPELSFAMIIIGLISIFDNDHLLLLLIESFAQNKTTHQPYRTKISRRVVVSLVRYCNARSKLGLVDGWHRQNQLLLSFVRSRVIKQL